MYAVIQAGGHQYRVIAGEAIVVDKINGNAGDKITFDKVLMLGGSAADIRVGKPYLSGVSVVAEIKEQTRNDKTVTFKYRRRKNSKVMRGHRQPVTVVEVKNIIA